MMTHALRLIPVLLMLLADCHAWASPPATARLEAHGQTTDGTPIKAVVVTKRFSQATPYDRDARWWGVIDDGLTTPKIIVSAIDVWVGRKKLHVPLSAFADLSEPTEVSVVCTAQGLTVTLRGGDAAASYEAMLVFEQSLIRSRKVAHMEFPDEAWEETNYSFNINR